MTLEQLLLISITILSGVMLIILISQLRRQDVMSGRADEQARQFEILRALVEQKISHMLESMTAFQNQLKINEIESRESQSKRISNLEKELSGKFNEFKTDMAELLFKNNESNQKNQAESLKTLNQTLVENSKQQNEQIAKSLKSYADEFGKRVDSLTDKTDFRLKEISGQVEKKLGEGFDKTTETFANVLKRLTLIDEAQKKITELSGNVVSLQEVLADKRSRGAFGEVQLSALVANVMPAQSYALQFGLSNNTRVDCMLFLPQPSGNIAVDSKFPLESYQKLSAFDVTEADKLKAEKQFKADIKKHIKDIADKYIIPGETAEGAVMFIPAESVFAEIHAHHPDLVEESQKKRVWMVSPTTLMAVLTTARAVIKDDATRQQVHLIQEHLSKLSVEFGRFGSRMENLSRHISQAHKDVGEVKITADKIKGQFISIEKVELDDITKEIGVLDSNAK
ncbi:MAG: DNA recombination protein RmuC [Gammaproteobacteria bacterium]|nr:DNA recombination protein RmuC [Gammaproteobacteria bacterium]